VGQLRNKKLLVKTASQIKMLRTSKNLTQEDVYNDANIHLGRIETSKINVGISTLKYLCEYFGVTLYDFFKKIEE
jgi:transcriptional regulator with XRE-family HTH domain